MAPPRPANSVPRKHTVEINVPAGWYTTVSAISRKPYNQLVRIRYSERDGINTEYFLNQWGVVGDTMTHRRSRVDSYRIYPLETPISLEFSFFYSLDMYKAGVILENENATSSKLHVTSISKPGDVRDDFPDYSTFFIFVEDAEDDAQVPGSGQFDDAVVLVHLLKKTEAAPLPPPAPVYVAPTFNTGYPLLLDEPRPTTIHEYFNKYQTAIIVDDSSAVIGQKWLEIRDAITSLTEENLQRVDLYFLNSQMVGLGVNDAEQVEAYFSEVRPGGDRPIGNKLRFLAEKHLKKLETAVGTARYKATRPLDIIVVTTGPSTDNVRTALIDIAKRLRAGRHHANFINIQLVHVGPDRGAESLLRDYTLGEVSYLADVVPYTSTLTGGRLQEVLLRTTHPSIRARQYHITL
ncbi:hypothetical protein BOTBODRAFT_59339 [Botryobasidium botryosum FD-172 SS1]|uniref:VWFA domain-containing protein n=1 Tax=Botryobasidium botryosum (strain FD-172 SS1) TaxID=930990 RepID=A0A067LYK1_BOTB1|nr:hypothetical protein BOTBODRAFT_59339 [Botryobasidium botryosum FD-172 SS1]